MDNRNVSELSDEGSTIGCSTTTKTSSSMPASGSKVWVHFERIEIMENGSKTVKARCKYCGNSLLAGSRHGTSHLRRHGEKCATKIGIDFNQAQLDMPPTPTAVNLPIFQYDPVQAREEVCNYIVMNDQPLTVVENRQFEGMIQRGFCPQYQNFSRDTAKNDILQKYSEYKEKLIQFFAIYNGKISLSCDLWESNQNLKYICLTAHYIDNKWCMQKRIISFKLVSLPYTGITLGEQIADEIAEWGLEGKIFSIVLDSSPYWDNAVEYLKTVWYLPLRGKLFHINCCCHILNLIIQDGLRVPGVESAMHTLRNIVFNVNSSSNREKAFKNACRTVNMKHKKLPLGMETRWNTMFIMLKVMIKYRRAVEMYLRNQSSTSRNSIPLPSENDWVYGNILKEFLKVFEYATKVFSGIYYPTSCRVLAQLAEIHTYFLNYFRSEGEIYVQMVGIMKENFDKYWNPLPLVFGLAFILDPRVKLSGLEFGLSVLYSGGSISSDIYVSTLHQLFDEYKDLVQTAKPISVKPISTFASLDSKQKQFMQLMKRHKMEGSSSSSSVSELQLYLDMGIIEVEDYDSLDLLAWWRAQAMEFPVLSTMARDILTIPASTVNLESAFNLGGHVMDEYKNALAPTVVEALTCLKDWILADERTQDDEEMAKLEILMDKMRMGEDEAYDSD